MDGTVKQLDTIQNNNKRTCQFFVPHKKRFCKSLVATGNNFCGQHLVGLDDVKNCQSKRIPCPLDPKHSCYEHKLEKHLQHCNARENTNCPYKTTNCNLDVAEQEPKKLRLSDITDDDLSHIINRIEQSYQKYIEGSIKEEIYNHKAVNDPLMVPESAVYRHLCQNASLLGHIDKFEGFNSTTKNTCYIEFGAGRGQMSKWMVEATEDYKNKTFLLVERGGRRHKQDAKLRCNSELDIRRLRIDIQHLDLNKVDAVTSAKYVYGVGKHLCGAATDLTLRCLAENTSTSSIIIVIALCCHNQCTYTSYTGKQFLQEAGYTPSEFYILLGLTSWAVCGIKKKDDEMNPKINVNREEIGRKTKLLLDYGRLQYLKKHSFDSKLVKYVKTDMTLENIALIATKTK